MKSLLLSLIILSIAVQISASVPVKHDPLADSAKSLFGQRKLDESLALFKKAIANSTQKTDVEYWGSYAEIIGYLYCVNLDFKNAQIYYEVALNYQLGLHKDYESIARVMIGLGLIYKTIGQGELALNILQRAEFLLSLNQNYSYLLSDVKTSIGDIYQGYGDYQKALRYYLFGQQLAISRGDTSSYFFINSYSSLGTTYINAYEYDKAISCFIRLSKIKSLSLIERQMNLSMLGRCYYNMGMMDSAEYYFNLINWNTVEQSSTETLLNYAIFLCRTGSFLKAKPIFLRVIKSSIGLVGEIHAETSRAYYHYADYWNRCEQPDSALYYLDRALLSLGCNPKMEKRGNQWIGETPYVRHLIPILEQRGKAYFMKGMRGGDQQIYWLKCSLRMYRIAAHVIGKTYSDYESDDSRIFLSQSESGIFTEAIKVCLALYAKSNNSYWQERAFEFSEQGKAGALMTTFRKRDAFHLAKVCYVFKKTDKRLNAAVYQTEQQLAQGAFGDTGTMVTLRKQLVQLYHWRERLERSIAANYPAFARLGWDETFPSMRSISAVLDHRSAMLEYVCDSSLIRIFCITSSSVKIVEVPVDRSFYYNLQQYKNVLSQSVLGSGRKEYCDFTLNAHALWKVLIGPVNDQLNKRDRIIIAPDATLAGISFDALIDKVTDTSSKGAIDFRQPSYLIKSKALTYCYSAGWLRNIAASSRQSQGALVLFAPQYPKGARSGKELLPSLEGAQAEARFIANQWSGHLYEGKDATRTRFLEVAPDARILHLAMHSSADDESTLESHLIFSVGDSNQQRLNAADIYSMRIPAEMVVLNSCNSGKGKTLKGEGMMSLARAFIYSGSQSVIMSMWPVNDAAGAEVMRNFYCELANGKPSDIALQQAKLGFLKNVNSTQTHPAFWCSYALVGQPKQILLYKSAEVGEQKYYLLFLILIMIGLLHHHYREDRLL